MKERSRELRSNIILNEIAPPVLRVLTVLLYTGGFPYYYIREFYRIELNRAQFPFGYLFLFQCPLRYRLNSVIIFPLFRYDIAN